MHCSKMTDKKITIRDFRVMSSEINLNPIGQRPPVENNNEGGGKTPSKYQAIVGTIIQGRDIGEVVWCENKPGEQYDYECLDGSNRLRSVENFCAPYGFKTHKSLDEIMPGCGGKTFRELPKAVQEAFLNYKIRVVVYPICTTEEKAQIFQDKNNSTQVNPQEYRNSYGDTFFANLIRNAVRKLEGVNSEPHRLFDRTVNGKLKKLGAQNLRLAWEERLVRVCFYILHGLKETSPKDLTKLYQRKFTPVEQKYLEKELKKFLDFINEVAVERCSVKCELPIGEFTILSRSYFDPETPYKNSSLQDVKTFYKGLAVALIKVGEDSTPWVKNGKAEYVVSKAYTDYISRHDIDYQLFDSLKILKEIGGWSPFEDGSMLSKDPNRDFPLTWRLDQWEKQDRKCYITGKDLAFKDAVSGHKKAHSKGGFTERKNLCVIDKTVNRDMGAAHADDYKTMLENKKKTKKKAI